MQPGRAAMWIPALIAIGLLGAGIAFRSFEYDETYTHVLMAGEIRPDWPREPAPAGELRDRFSGLASPGEIMRQLVKYDIHPPFYFWVHMPWRWLLGPDALTTRLMSGLLMLGAFALVWRLARLASAPPLLACSSATLSYVLIYLGTISRAYALAMAMVMLAAVLLARALQGAERHPLRRPGRAGTVMAGCAGLLLGLAVFSNYLAVLVAAALFGALGLAWLLGPARPARLTLAVAALAGFLPPFLAVLALRQSQGSAEWLLPGFDLADALIRAGRGQTAALFGGLPMYVTPPWSTLVAMPVVAAGGVMAVLVLLGALLGRAWRDPVRLLVLAGALSMPAGLLALGFVTGRSPFEFRYFVFGAPFLAIAFAIGAGELARRGRPGLAGLAAAYVLVWQAAGVLPLPFAQATQQEYRHLVRQAAPHWQPGSLLLVPSAKDGVGMNGPWTWEAPRHWLLRVVRPDDEPEALAAQIREASRLLVVTLADHVGEAALQRLRQAMALQEDDWELQASWHGLEIWAPAAVSAAPMAAQPQGGPGAL